MLSEQYAALIDECVAEVQTRSGHTRTFKPPANPMRAGAPGAKRSSVDLSYLDLPQRTEGPRRARRTLALAAAAVVGLLSLSGIWLMRASGPQSTPSAPAPLRSQHPAQTPQSAAKADLARGLSCHQIERDLMSTVQNENGSFYSQAQADSLLATEGANC